jgi:hypothetical protein
VFSEPIKPTYDVGVDDQVMSDAMTVNDENMEGSLSSSASSEKRDATVDLPCQRVADDVVDLTISSSDEAELPAELNAATIDLLTPEKPFKDPFKDYSNQKRPMIKLVFKRDSPRKEDGSHEQQNCSIVISDDEEIDLHSDAIPSLDDPVAVAERGLSMWTKLNDRDRLLITVLLNLGDHQQEVLFELFSNLQEGHLWSSMCEIMDAALKGVDKIRGVNLETQQIHGGVLRLFWIYVDCRHHPVRRLRSDEIKNLRSRRLLFTPFHALCYRILQNPIGKPDLSGNMDAKLKDKVSVTLANGDGHEGSKNSDDGNYIDDDDEPVSTMRSRSRLFR